MTTSDHIYSETDTGKNDFLSKTCIQWEQSYQDIKLLSDKNCIIRIGIVLSKDGGALRSLVSLFKTGLGSAIGSGNQYMPWIHETDLLNIFHESLFNAHFKGIYNAVSTESATNYAFSEQLAKSLRKPFFVPKVPAFILKLALGEMSGVLLEGSRVSNQKLIDSGFTFQFPLLSPALNELVTKK
ncbi:MAG: DUF1731 domain-containing protein [Bacteroidota bacterium]